MFRLFLFFAALFGSFWLFAGPARAENAVVGNGTPGSCTEIHFDTALATVQESGGGTVTFHCGGPVTITFQGGKSIKANADVTLDGGDQITLSGGNAVRHFTVEGGGKVTLRNITLTSGYNNNFGGGSILGLAGSSLTLENTTVHNSNVGSGYSGGAILSHGVVTMSNSLIENNTGGSAGGLFLLGEAADGTITNSTFRNNRTTSPEYGYGGAITLWDGADVTLQGTTLTQNQARFGGAIYNQQSVATTIDIRQNSTLSQNEATEWGGGIYAYRGAVYLTDVAVSANSAGYGGGIFLGLETAAILTNVTINNNTAKEYGGGVYLRKGSLILTRVAVTGNTAVAQGGGLRNSGGTVDITDSTFSSNSATGAGGGISQDDLADTMLYQVTISDNTAVSGGGVYQYDGSLVLSRSTLSHNVAANPAVDGHGGGLFISTGKTDIVDSTLTGNSAASGGGGVFIRRGTLTIVRSTIHGNNAAYHGGGIQTYPGGGILNLTNVTISQNRALYGGGAELDGVTSNLSYVTFDGNSAQEEGNSLRLGEGTSTWKNVIVQAGSGGDCAFAFDRGKITSAGYNLAGDGSCNLNGVGDQEDVDAHLGSLQDNGGFTLTHLPQLGSPALDSGQCIPGITNDQRSVARPQAGTCDRGAVERTPEDVDRFSAFLPLLIK